MNESRFEQLVNLYLDKEISPEEYAALKAELSASVSRQRTFRRYRALRAAENQSICAAFKHDPADDILPEPSTGQKAVVYVAQLGGMAAAVALAVTAFVYATRGDSEQLGRSIADDLAEMGNKIDTHKISDYAGNQSDNMMGQLMEAKTTTAVGASRVADKLRVWVATSDKDVQVAYSQALEFTEADQLSVDEMTTRRRILSELKEMPGTSATVSFPGQQPFGYHMVASSGAY